MLEILTVENELLTTPCEDIKGVDGDIRKLAKNMRAAMKHAGGVGLAAPQIGVLLNLVVVKLDLILKKKLGRVDLVMINPVITFESGNHTIFTESCLSIPGVKVRVSRPETVSVSYRDLLFKTQRLENVSGLMSHIIQHELDHLQGRLITDYVSRPA